jgi:organic radical activating enzyme
VAQPSDSSPADSNLELKVSEIFASIQGEGASAGEPASFLRLAGCNLHCAWCDTKYTWDWKNFDYEQEVQRLPVRKVVEHLHALAPRRLVITGGEPLLQQSGIAVLLEQLAGNWIVEVETNGTMLPDPALLGRVQQWNISPKLAHASDPQAQRIQLDVLRTFAPLPHAWLKIVIQQQSDLTEANPLVAQLDWPKERILLMPEASTAAQLQERTPLITDLARSSGYGVSPRLHVARWDGKRGV